ncbi:MOSC domain-containing protein [Sphingorhabdus sp. EL138]|uniref:MOSC domain-containing protein n=1 Tax=Sphingorhabdus sp. EL138 TaxID=2073156 RepID=UPI0025DE5F23|nr:MOSC domain-containing protein [Sphingorhabdus sp. EL138]
MPMGMVHLVRYISNMILSQIDVLLIGQPKPFHADGTMSAMARLPVDRPVFLGKHGFEGDRVADPTVHGGADKAVHFYPAEHYPKWIAHFAAENFVHPLLDQAGAFGENISASGLTEDKVRIGDRFRIGKALVEVAQGRQPCWKLDHHFGVHGLSGAIINGGHCGGYFRVIEEGEVAPGDSIEQVHAAEHDWTVARTFNLLIGGGHRAIGAKSHLRALAALETMAESWRTRAAKLAG